MSYPKYQPGAFGESVPDGVAATEQGGDVNELSPEQEAEHRKVVDQIVPQPVWTPEPPAADEQPDEEATELYSEEGAGHFPPDDPPAARICSHVDLDGTLVGGSPYWRVSVRLPRRFGFWIARRRGVIA